LSKYLVVGKIDKIQTFIFQSTRLREIAGANQLLLDFCNDVRNKKVFPQSPQVLDSSGSNFWLVFQNEADAQKGIEILRKEAMQKIGASITVVCLPYDGSNPSMVNIANQKLKLEGFNGHDPEPLWHSPYHAICASSGEELAVSHERPGGFLDNGQPRFPDERPRYMGKTTLQKGDEQAVINLLDAFITRMKAITEIKEITKLSKPTEADTYAQFDPRQYVAYLVSDGNGMGKIFNACLPTQLSELSAEMGEITSDALIHATEGMCAETHKNDQMQFPILPLISGGDDLFVLMPAPWAVHVAMEFSRNYQDSMTKQLHNMGLLNEEKNATTGVAVVICKASYPYRTAYQYAHELLGKAKKRAKDINQSCLIVDFVVGSDTVTANTRAEPQAHTYKDAEYFITHRFDLRGLPSRILHQIESALIQEGNTNAIVERVRQLYPDFEYADALQVALSDAPRLRELLKLWDFCYDMREERDKYLTEER